MLILPRTEEALVRDYVKFRVRGIVYVSISQDETLMGFGFPKEERAALVASEPEKFLMPVPSDERYRRSASLSFASDTACAAVRGVGRRHGRSLIHKRGR
ncbi:hypothetical protein [Microbispora bryophytorum]|uniref:hypothetical protein n=1 Tax=Microbispora bryophytorum TaxID=1460882 RepID=UPI00295F3F6F|nr:hypothetical protein [Microbispora camponoti]